MCTSKCWGLVWPATRRAVVTVLALVVRAVPLVSPALALCAGEGLREDSGGGVFATEAGGVANWTRSEAPPVNILTWPRLVHVAAARTQARLAVARATGARLDAVGGRRASGV